MTRAGGVWPEWVAPSLDAMGDLLMLASLRFDLDLAREPAGVIAAVSWVVGTGPGPATGRREGPRAREVAVCELRAAECLLVAASGAQPPPLRQVCTQLGVRHVPVLVDADPGYGLGVHMTLSWALGEAPVAPMRLPLRDPGGRVLGEDEVFAGLTASGMDPGEARRAAREMVADSRRLADLVRVRAAVPAVELDTH